MTKNNSELIKNVLMGLAVGGAIAVAVTSPYFLANLTKGLSAKELERLRRKIKSMLYYLKRKKLVILKEEPNGEIVAQLSEWGRKRIVKYQLEDLKIKKPVRWDKKWRLIIFDIPHKLKWAKTAREALRFKLKELGFYQLQKSVWIYPYDCENEILFLKEIFRLGPFVKYLEVTKIDDEIKLKKIFDLI